MADVGCRGRVSHLILVLMDTSVLVTRDEITYSRMKCNQVIVVSAYLQNPLLGKSSYAYEDVRLVHAV